MSRRLRFIFGGFCIPIILQFPASVLLVYCLAAWKSVTGYVWLDLLIGSAWVTFWVFLGAMIAWFGGINGWWAEKLCPHCSKRLKIIHRGNAEVDVYKWPE